MRQRFEVELPLRALFEAPTVAALALRVEEAQREARARRGSGAPALVPVERHGPLPLSFAQQRLWFLDQLEPGRARSTTCRWRCGCTGRLDVAALQRSARGARARGTRRCARASRRWTARRCR